jgi:hypothetical protein
MAKSTEVERGSSQVTDAADSFRETAGGAIGSYRLCSIASDGDVEQSVFNDAAVVGVNRQEAAVAAGDQVRVGYGRNVVVADQVITSGQRLKAASGGKVTQFVDSALTGTTIEDNIGIEFTNQPANDGVEIVSASAADTTQTVTVYYTRNALGDTVYTETKTLNGTTQVVLTHTDVELVLAVEKSAATAGTITFREASGNATIVTLAAGTLSAGKIAVTAGQTKAYNTAPTAVAGGASTKQVGLIGTDENDAVLYDSQALNGATAVTFNDTFKTVTFLLMGDVAAATTVTVKVGAEDSRRLYVGKALESASAADALLDAFIMPE